MTEPQPVDGSAQGGPSQTPPAKPSFGARVRSLPRRVVQYVITYFRDEPLTFVTALVPLCFLSIALYTRHPRTNFIFDEQEALLANPFVRSVTDHSSHLHWIDAFRRDFWGLPHDRTIGSYRPLPDLVWRLFWWMGAREQSPFLHHWVNVLLHGVNGAIVAVLALRVTKDRATAWLAGTLFTATAVVTEAVSGVVGLADVLGALGALLALCSLALPMWAMPFAVLLSTLFGLYSKESALCIVPMIPFAALVLSQVTHPEHPRRWIRAGLAGLATAAAFVFYVEQRRRSFPATLPPDLSVAANIGKPWAVRFYHGLLRWYAQPILPKDPLNNPLVNATGPFRVAGGLRVYARGLGEVLLPYRLSGDYSSPQEPIPAHLIFPESIVGALALVGPIIAAPILGFLGIKRKKPLYALAAVSMLWIVVSYFPVSNIPILLPTVRAERFWYFPAIGTSCLLAIFFAWLIRKTRASGQVWAGATILAVFLLWQCVAARAHANDYTDDLVFWDATRKAVPRSAKAHLNYSVMQGARGNLEERRKANAVALALAPEWPMANIYMGDTLCRMHRPAEAWPHYKRGFELAPGDPNLIALALQCLWDEKYFQTVAPELSDMGEQRPGSWLDFLQRDMAEHGQEHNGVDPKYRPRSYNEGPKDDN
ncbi:MAG TPA: tetratricopeptide repeat protein [Polyangiaceae bacterium]|jgi:hypothetical protein